MIAIICLLAGVLCGFAHPAEQMGFSFVILFLPGSILYLTRTLSSKSQFVCCTLFFFAMSAICMRWICFHLYADALIYSSWTALCLVFALGFGLFSLLCRRWLSKGLLSLVALSLLWCSIEWSRHFLFSGYPWIPLGVYTASNVALMQWGSIVGVYGLSFVVMFLNLLFVQFLQELRFLRGACTISALILGMILAGAIRLELFSEDRTGINSASKVAYGIMQTGIYPHHKSYSPDYFDYWVPAETMLSDWAGIIKEQAKAKTILFPECVFSFSSTAARLHIGALSLGKLGPYLSQENAQESEPLVSAISVFQKIAEKFQKQIIVGFEQESSRILEKGYFNSAYLFSSLGEVNSTDKAMLVPFGEYPTWLSEISYKIPQGGEFNFGSMTKPLFKLDDGFLAQITICFEDIFPHLIRKWLKGAEIHFNITNDGWFLSHLLGEQHLIHSQFRSVENGITTLRVTSTGPSAHIDPFGRILNQTPISLNVLQPEPIYTEWTVIPKRIETIYSKYGDLWIAVLILISAIFNFINRKHISLIQVN